MNREEFYESLIAYSVSQKTTEIVFESEQEHNNYMTALTSYYKIRDLSVDEIDLKIDDAENENLKILLQEMKYVKEYQLVVKKYPRLFLPLKIALKNKLEKEIAEIKNNEDIVHLVTAGEEMIQSTEKPLYLGISLALVYDRLNKVDQANELMNRMIEWYADSQVITDYLKKMLRNICFRNRIYKQYRKLLQETGDKTLIYLYRNIEFFQFQYNWYIILLFFGFLFLWIILGFKILYLFSFLIIINILNIAISFKKKDLLILNAYVIKLFVYFLIIGMTAILYFLAKSG